MRPPAKHRARSFPLRPGTRGKHRIPRSPHRTAGYAAAGVLAVTGTVAAGAPVLARDPGARPVPPKPAAQAVVPPAAPRRDRASRSTTRRPALRWVVKTIPGQVLTGRATWYGPGFAGHSTASGEVFDPRELTAAHRTLPFGTRLRICLHDRCVVVRINDRGPFGNAILDISRAAAERIGLIGPGIATVTAKVLETRKVQVPA